MRAFGRILLVGSAVAFAGGVLQCKSGDGTENPPDQQASEQDLSGPSVDFSTPGFHIASITPSGGLNNAATPITISGGGFVSGATVTIGGQLCASPNITANQIVCTAPSKVAFCGPQPLVLTNGDGKTANATFFYASQFPSFIAATPPTQTVLQGPRRLITADWNGDGEPDVADVETISPQLTVFIGKGNGSFNTGVSYSTVNAKSPVELATGDVTSDGKLDILVANQGSDNFTVYQNTGSGAFKPGVNVPTGLTSPQSLALADFNNDGKLDVVLASSNQSVVSVGLGNGDGTFQTTMMLATVLPGFLSGVTAADVNGDKRVDIIAVSGNSGIISLLLGNGDGNFQLAKNVGNASTSPTSIVAADVDGDQMLDLVTANSNGGNVSVLIGNGDGSFRGTKNYGVGGIPDALAVVDINRDGYIDFLTANTNSNNWSIVLGLGKGLFGGFYSFSFGSSARGITVGDWNRDSLPDVAVTSYNSMQVGFFLQQCK